MVATSRKILMSKAWSGVIDWFIPDASSIGAAELGLARNFVVNQFLGPLFLQPVAFLLYFLDPAPGAGFWAIVGCISASWLMPLGLKLTRNFRLVAIAAVELLCAVALLGAFQYGGTTSPFLPWLLVSLMLGFFYLSDRSVLVVALFSGNIALTIIARLVFPSHNHIPVADLSGVTWFSIFAATGYMSRMAIYYANIISMSSELERSIESHRSTAVALRLLKSKLDAENHGKTIFLEKMSRQVQTPLSSVIERSQTMLDRTSPDRPDRLDITRINTAGHKLQVLLADVLNVEKAGSQPLQNAVGERSSTA